MDAIRHGRGSGQRGTLAKLVELGAVKTFRIPHDAPSACTGCGAPVTADCYRRDPVTGRASAQQAWHPRCYEDAYRRGANDAAATRHSLEGVLTAVRKF